MSLCAWADSMRSGRVTFRVWTVDHVVWVFVTFQNEFHVFITVCLIEMLLLQSWRCCQVFPRSKCWQVTFSVTKIHILIRISNVCISTSRLTRDRDLSWTQWIASRGAVLFFSIRKESTSVVRSKSDTFLRMVECLWCDIGYSFVVMQLDLHSAHVNKQCMVHAR